MERAPREKWNFISPRKFEKCHSSFLLFSVKQNDLSFKNLNLTRQFENGYERAKG